MSEITLTAAQQEIYDYFVPKAPAGFHLLSAEAGVGKTTLVKKIFENSKRGTCFILCPTHKAKSLYKYPFPESGCIQTIHRFFGSELSYTDDGQRVFNFKVPNTFSKKNNKVSLYTIIVDEASMVSGDMLKVFDQIKDVTTVLFTCDEAQLPPVDEVVSPIYKIKDIVKFSLTQNMRAEESLALDQVRHFRRNVFASAKVPTFSAPFECPEAFLLQSFKDGADSVVITWTNARKNFWNSRIREFLFSEEKELEKLYVGEQLIFSGHRKTLDEVYYSSDPVFVEELEEAKIMVDYVPAGCSCPRNAPSSRLQIQECALCGIDGRKTLGIDVEFFILKDQFGVEWKVPKNAAAERSIKRILSHEKKHILKMKTRQDVRQLWAKYYARALEFNPDLSYSYAITCHKSQGSEWKRVFMDYTNLSQAREPRGIKERLLYTSASRMREELYFTPTL